MSVYKDLLQHRSGTSKHSDHLLQHELPLPEGQVRPIVDQVVDSFQSESTSRFALISFDKQAGTTTISRQVAIMLGARTFETKILLVHANLGLKEDSSEVPESLILDNSPVGIDVLRGFPNSDILRRIDSDYDLIIVDSPPLNSPDAMRVLRWVSSVVPIIVANQTAHSTAQSAIDRLHSIPVNIMGVVLNRRTYHIPQVIYSRL